MQEICSVLELNITVYVCSDSMVFQHLSLILDYAIAISAMFKIFHPEIVTLMN